jgi:hypothetical protein
MKTVSKTSIAVGLALAGLFLTGRNAHSQAVLSAKVTDFCDQAREELTEARSKCPRARGIGIGAGAFEVGGACVIDRNVLRKAVRCLETINRATEDQNPSGERSDPQDAGSNMGFSEGN